jgi:hypothetical protein
MKMWMRLRMDKRLWMLISILLFILVGFWVVAPQSKDNFSFWSLLAAVAESGTNSGAGIAILIIWALLLACCASLVGLVLHYVILLIVDHCRSWHSRRTKGTKLN